MKISIFLGGPRRANTLALTRYFKDELEKCGALVALTALSDKKIAPCKGCYACQQVSNEYGCVQRDDMRQIADEIISADIIVFAAPIYTWYCPADMKAMLDRLYGMNKFYGKGSGSLWAGKTVALLLTHGYDAQYAAEPFVMGMKRLCEHSRLMYAGMYSVRDTDDLASFTTVQAQNGARVFAQRLIALEGRKQAALSAQDAPITKAGFSIRVAIDENDSASANEIYSQSWRAGYKGVLRDDTIDSVTDDGWRAQFENNFVTNRYMLSIMSAEGKDIGACAIGVKQGDETNCTAEIISFYYIKEYWGKKYNGLTYAEHLMRYALAVIRRQGYRSVELWALKGNARAIAFYQKCGFSLTGGERRLSIKGEAITVAELKKDL